MTLDDQKSQKIPFLFSCKCCVYNSNNKKDYEKHLHTMKHKFRSNDDQMMTNDDQNGTKSPHEYHYCLCGRRYKYKQGLSKHKKLCNHNSENKEDFKEIVMKLMTENQEIKKENHLLVTKITELIPMIGDTNSHNNNIKQRFNINVFLNEKCKDALSMDQFIEKIEISMKNLLTTKDKGLGEGLSNIIIDNMNKLSLYERPMHCTDKKRETLYIKNEEWEKDEKQELINRLLKQVENKQMKNITQWTEKHPNYMEDEKLQEEYIDLIRKCTSSVEECREKVLKKVCDNVYLTEK
tara:strand:- start:367 stop:1248 length:882 start_codon:yes stop_codon:yes gene_type:complete